MTRCSASLQPFHDVRGDVVHRREQRAALGPRHLQDVCPVPPAALDFGAPFHGDDVFQAVEFLFAQPGQGPAELILGLLDVVHQPQFSGQRLTQGRPAPFAEPAKPKAASFPPWTASAKR